MPTGPNVYKAAELLMRQQTGAAGLARTPTVSDEVYARLQRRLELFAWIVARSR